MAVEPFEFYNFVRQYMPLVELDSLMLRLSEMGSGTDT